MFSSELSPVLHFSPHRMSSGQVAASRNVSRLPNASWAVAPSSVNLASNSGKKSPFAHTQNFLFKTYFNNLMAEKRNRYVTLFSLAAVNHNAGFFLLNQTVTACSVFVLICVLFSICGIGHFEGD